MSAVTNLLKPVALLRQDGELLVSQRLLAGACAGVSATFITHPLDVIRLRLSLPQTGYTGVVFYHLGAQAFTASSCMSKC